MVLIVDAGTGNLRSLANALAGLCVTVAAEPPADLPDSLILPGVGAFGHAMGNLRSAGFPPYVARCVEAGVRVVGICLGMQLLFERSEESPGIEGLGILKGEVRRFPAGAKVPHIGWARLEPAPSATDADRALRFAYFVHGYVVSPEDPSLVAATARHGVAFPAVVRRGSVVGVQFHPEKSQSPGVAYLRALVTGEAA